MKYQIPNIKSQINTKYQISNHKKRILWILIIWSLAIICNLALGTWNFARALDNEKLSSLSKEVIESKDSAVLLTRLEELKVLYFKEDKYSDFVEFLKSAAKNNKASEPVVNYYIALSRLNQLKYLEESQQWDEYFALGNNYREELTFKAEEAATATNSQDPLNLRARLVLWQFHYAQQDAFAQEALSGLYDSSLEYSKTAKDLKVIKEIADNLSSLGEKARSRELYGLYAKNIVAADTKDEDLLNAATGFYKEGNPQLAEGLFDVYIERITKVLPKEKSLPLIFDIARMFAYKDEGMYDMFYAEKVFAKIEELGSMQAFDQGLMYLRAFNLEKSKDYPKAKEIYVYLANKFPESSSADEALYKAGVISVYVLKDKAAARNFFEKLAQKEELGTHGAPSLYQLGLLAQWEEYLELAKEYYNRLIEKSKDAPGELASLTAARIKEIEESKPIEYNLKTFLDIALKEEYKDFNMSKLDLKAHPYKLSKVEEAKISCGSFTMQAGCMQVELQYLWSGQAGSAKPSSNQASFSASFSSSGTKLIFLVAVSPAGIIDYAVDMVDVY